VPMCGWLVAYSIEARAEEEDLAAKYLGGKPSSARRADADKAWLEGWDGLASGASRGGVEEGNSSERPKHYRVVAPRVAIRAVRGPPSHAPRCAWALSSHPWCAGNPGSRARVCVLARAQEAALDSARIGELVPGEDITVLERRLVERSLKSAATAEDEAEEGTATHVERVRFRHPRVPSAFGWTSLTAKRGTMLLAPATTSGKDVLQQVVLVSSRSAG
jgi:hypothetical protein